MGWICAGVPPVRGRSCIEASGTVLLILAALRGLSIQHVQAGRLEMNVSDARPIHPKNAAGPFYVVNGCCTACGVPTSIAPELFEFDSADHCYVKRQPASDTEWRRRYECCGRRNWIAFDIAARTNEPFDGWAKPATHISAITRSPASVWCFETLSRLCARTLATFDSMRLIFSKSSPTT